MDPSNVCIGGIAPECFMYIRIRSIRLEYGLPRGSLNTSTGSALIVFSMKEEIHSYMDKEYIQQLLRNQTLTLDLDVVVTNVPERRETPHRLKPQKKTKLAASLVTCKGKKKKYRLEMRCSNKLWIIEVPR